MSESLIDHVRGEDFVPTRNLEAILAAMEERGLTNFVLSLREFFGSTGAAYMAESYREAMSEVQSYREALEQIAAGDPVTVNGVNYIRPGRDRAIAALEADARVA